MNSMTRQKERILQDKLPRLVGAQYANGEDWRKSAWKNEEAGKKQNKQTNKQKKQTQNQPKNKKQNTQLWMCLEMEVKS